MIFAGGEEETADTSTIPSPESGVTPWEQPIRVVAIGFIGAMVVLAAFGLLGVRTTVTEATGNGFSMVVTHAAVTRAGLATPFSVEVATVDGSPLPAMTTIRVASPYLALFDDNGMEPSPASSFNTSDWTWWTFEVPPGTAHLRVDLDARLEPAVQWGREAEAAVEIDGEEVVDVRFTTWVMP
ncbi:MAG: hypothetical protein ACRDU9_09340 [Acidimicrobiia bacterium]